MEDVEETADDIPALDLANLPSWKIFQAAASKIVQPHGQNVLLFKGAVLVSGADEELSTLERDFLYSLAHHLRLSAPEAHPFIEGLEHIRLSDFRKTSRHPTELLENLYFCAMADGVVGESEKRMLRRIGSSLGMEEEEIEAVLSRTEGAERAEFLDSTGVKEHLANRTNLPSGTYLPENLRDSRLEELKRILDIPAQEEILLTYEDRILAEVLECAALTTRHLCIRPAQGNSLCVDLSRLDGFGSQIHSATLNLSGGDRIKLSRSGQGFLELLWECLEENLRSL